MGTVVQFAERLSEGGDWTPAERSQLRDMGAQLSEAAAGLDLVFGKTEEGDPWAVVADQHSEVLLHIARIGGAFVVHAPANDQTVESSDLWNAVTRVVGGVLQRRRGLVLPFPAEGMGQQAVLALMVAAAVRGDFHDILQGNLPGAPQAGDFTLTAREAAPLLPEHAEPSRSQAGDGHAQTRHGAATSATAASSHAGMAGAAPQPDGQPAQEIAPAAAHGGPLDGSVQPQQVATVQPMPWARTAPEPGRVVAAANQATTASGSAPTTAGGDKAAVPAAPPTGNDFAATGSAQGEGRSETGVATSGPTEGAGGMGGGAENHDIAVTANGPIARGATGSADTFVLNLPRSLPAEGAGASFAPAASAGSVSLGVVENFSATEGDRFLLPGGAAPTVTSVATLPEVTNMIPGAGVGGGALGVVITGRRFGFDLNGDGREDAYVMVLSTGEAPVLHRAAAIEISEVAPAGQADATVFIATVGIFIGH